MEQVGQRFFTAQQQAGRENASQIIRSTRQRRIGRRQVLGGGAAGLAMWLVWRQTPLASVSQRLANSLSADHHTTIGEQRQLILADGGQLWLNTATAVDIRYQETGRNITLLDGEILIDTAPDALQRSFVVHTPQGSLRALGTRFAVQQQSSRVLLAVYQGAVEIRTQQGQFLTVQAGQQSTFSNSHIGKPQPADNARQAWANGLIIANHIPLRSLVDELARYRHGHLSVSPQVAELQVVGTYPTDQPDHALAMLEATLPVKVERLFPWWVTISPEQ